MTEKNIEIKKRPYRLMKRERAKRRFTGKTCNNGSVCGETERQKEREPETPLQKGKTMLCLSELVWL